MKIIGLIAEYNPLHLGHLYQIKKIKEQYPNSLIILITNSCFTQRGDITILTRNDKTKIALDNQIDLIVELPFAYATQSADIFAYGALKILNTLKIDTLIFGSETNNIEEITKIANTQLNNKEYDKLVKQYLSTGINYPTALNKALSQINNKVIKEPNDLLALSYIKEIIKNKYPIIPISIKRIGSYHEKEVKNEFANASLIREKLLNHQSIDKYIPKNEKELLIKDFSLNNYFDYLKYKIISTPDLSIYQTVDEGIDNKIKKEIQNCSTWEELILKIKSKRYTYNKINRMLVHILTSFSKEEAKKIKIDYIKILGFNIKGQKYLNSIKKEINLPIIYNYKKNTSLLLDIEQRAITIYNLKIPTIKQINEYKQKPIIKTDAQ